LASEPEGSYHYNGRVVETPRHVELWLYGKRHYHDDTPKASKPRRKFEDMDDFEQMRALIRREKYYKDRLHVIRRLVDCNYVPGRSKFLTLTYADGSKTDPDECWTDFRDFIARLRYWLREKRGHDDEVPYLAVWEVQKERGATYGDFTVHWHVLLFDMGYLDQARIQDIWGLGIVDIRAIRKAKAAGDYVSKYISKAMAENSRRKRKAYYVSRGLKRPGENVFHLSGETVDERVRQALAEVASEKGYDVATGEGWAGDVLFENSYETPMGETVRYLSLPKYRPEPKEEPKRKGRSRGKPRSR